jgi:hypothetical protein
MDLFSRNVLIRFVIYDGALNFIRVCTRVFQLIPSKAFLKSIEIIFVTNLLILFAFIMTIRLERVDSQDLFS